jgi:transposase InsO family protein
MAAFSVWDKAPPAPHRSPLPLPHDRSFTPRQALNASAHTRACDRSDERMVQLPKWLHNYNWHKPRSSIGSKPPIGRLELDRNNLYGLAPRPSMQ